MLQKTQESYYDAAVSLQQTIASDRQQIDQLVDEIHGIKSLLREGFRLPLADKEQ